MTKIELKNKIEIFILSTGFYDKLKENYNNDFELLREEFGLSDIIEPPKLLMNVLAPKAEYVGLIPSIKRFKSKNNKNMIVQVLPGHRKIILHLRNSIRYLKNILLSKIYNDISSNEIEELIIKYFRDVLIHELVHYCQIINKEYDIILPDELKINNGIERKGLEIFTLFEKSKSKDYNFLMEYKCITKWYDVINKIFGEKEATLFYDIHGLNYLIFIIKNIDSDLITNKGLLVDNKITSNLFKEFYINNKTPDKDLMEEKLEFINSFKKKAEERINDYKTYFVE